MRKSSGVREFGSWELSRAGSEALVRPSQESSRAVNGLEACRAWRLAELGRPWLGLQLQLWSGLWVSS